MDGQYLVVYHRVAFLISSLLKTAATLRPSDVSYINTCMEADYCTYHFNWGYNQIQVPGPLVAGSAVC